MEPVERLDERSGRCRSDWQAYHPKSVSDAGAGMRALMRGLLLFALVPALLCAPRVAAQTEFQDNENLAPDRPEAWAMSYFTATSFMSAFGATPTLSTGGIRIAVELGEIPHLDESQRRVGFNGSKSEDLNKSPVFGRLRAWVGLPHGFVAELAYTPPVMIDGAQPEDLVSMAIARRLIGDDEFSLSARVFGQHGSVAGDVTCPEEIAGNPDFEVNPFGCQAASDDSLELNYYGLDTTGEWTRSNWHWHVSLGVVRVEPEVQVDAYTFDFHDRSRLVARDVLQYLAVGGGYDWAQHWGVRMELLYVPLEVRREAGGPLEDDPLTSLRLQLHYDLR